MYNKSLIYARQIGIFLIPVCRASLVYSREASVWYLLRRHCCYDDSITLSVITVCLFRRDSQITHSFINLHICTIRLFVAVLLLYTWTLLFKTAYYLGESLNSSHSEHGHTWRVRVRVRVRVWRICRDDFTLGDTGMWRNHRATSSP